MRRHARVAIAATTLALVTTTLGAAPPGAGAAPPGSTRAPDNATSSGPEGSVAPGDYTLLTGDRVRVGTSPDGDTTAALLPGSPHYGGPVQVQNLGDHLYVIPKLPLTERLKLDTSVFDVGALSRVEGRVPLSVTFDRGATPRDLPGIEVDDASAMRLGTGATVVRASYDARAPLPPSVLDSLGGVARVKGPESTLQRAPGDYVLHTLTVKVTDRKGKPVPYAGLSVMNTRDARLFSGAGDAVDGEWRVSVPEGDYIILAATDRAVLAHEVNVSADTTNSLSEAEATVQPSMRVRGKYQQLEPSLTLIRDASEVGGLSSTYSGFMPRINPQKPAEIGRKTTLVSTLWANKNYNLEDPASYRLLIQAKESESGVPRDLSYRYRASDFTHNKVESYTSGATESGFLGSYAYAPGETFAWISLYPYQRPTTVRAWYQKSKAIRWNTLVTAGNDFDSPDLSDMRKIRKPVTIPFFKGPVSPVQDRGLDRNATSFTCPLCVKNGRLSGLLAGLSTGGTSQFGSATGKGAMRWTLRRGKKVLAKGKGLVSFEKVSVKPGQWLTLSTATSLKKWKLSDRSSSTFRFQVPKRDGAVPLSRSAWSVPMDLQGVISARTVTFPLSFDNVGPARNRIRSAQVSYSTNGKSWRKAKVSRTGAHSFRVRYPNPPGSNRVSIRVSAEDARGQSSTEQVSHVYTTGGRGRVAAQDARATDTVNTADTVNAVSTVGVVDTVAASSRAGLDRRSAHRFNPKRLCRASDTRMSTCYAKLQHSTRVVTRGTSNPKGLGAQAIRTAYGIPSGGADTTVGIVVAYDYPTAERDLNVYRKQFGLPPCTTANGCFKKINQKGETGNYPQPDQGWSVEAALDLQMVSAACPTCKLVLAEARQPVDAALTKATRAAIGAGATVTNHSYGRIELTGDSPSHFAAYDQPGVTAVSATGDYGYQPASVPVALPNVVAVGGTKLKRTSNARGWIETAWEFGGSGCSAYFAKPAWQTDRSCGMRTIGDLSAVADRLAVYNTYVPKRYRGWLLVGGTSASSPIVAGLIGAAGSGGMKPDALYNKPGAFFDVTTGANGFCKKNYMCTAKPGYDAPTGFGTPRGLTPFLAVPPTEP